MNGSLSGTLAVFVVGGCETETPSCGSGTRNDEMVVLKAIVCDVDRMYRRSICGPDAVDEELIGVLAWGHAKSDGEEGGGHSTGVG